MANTNQKFIDTLQNFAMSIYEIADEMKQSKSSDGDMFKAIVSVEKISNSIKADVLSIKNETSEILKNTKNIIKQLSNSKITEKKKEKSVFDSLADKQSKTNIGDGIKSILLISTAVIAIGSAFSILKDVDFGTVMALTISLPILAYSFIEVANSGLKPDKAFEVSKSLMLMSLSLLATSYILSFMPTMDNAQLKSVIVATGVITAIGFVGKALQDKAYDKGNIAQYLLAPFIITAIGVSIIATSYILPFINKEILNKDVLNAVLVMIPISIGLGIVGKIMSNAVKGLNLTQLLFASVMLPIISIGVVLASKILTEVDGNVNLVDVLKATVASTIVSIGAFIMMKLLSKLSVKETLVGSFNLVVISVAVAVSSQILSKGDYKNFPDYKWSIGVGLSMLLLALPVIGLGYAGIGVVSQGALGLVLVAGAILAMSHIFALLPKDVFGKGSIMDDVLDSVTRLIRGLTDIFVVAVKELLPPLAKFLVAINPLMFTLSELFPILADNFRQILTTVQPIAMLAIETIGTIVKEIDDIVISVAKVIESIGGVITSIGDSIAKVINSIGDSFVKVKDSIVGIVNAFTSLSAGDILKIASVGSTLTSTILDIGGAVKSIKGKEFTDTAMALFYLGTGFEKLSKVNVNGIGKNIGEIIKSASKLTTIASSINTLSESITNLSKSLAGEKGFSTMLDRFVYNMVALSMINESQLQKNLKNIAENYNKISEKNNYKTSSQSNLKESSNIRPVSSGNSTVVNNQTIVNERAIQTTQTAQTNKTTDTGFGNDLKELVKLMRELLQTNQLSNGELMRLVEISESSNISTSHIRN